MLPDDIQQESFRIIDREVGRHSFTALEWPIVRRMIHAAGDLELVHSMIFRNDAAGAGIEAMRAGAPLITDVNMVAAGIDRPALDALQVRLHCFIDDPEVARQAKAQGRTRSACAMEKALAEWPDGVYAIGNAPTALAEVCRAVEAKRARPRLLLALPVGFVGVIESKEQALVLEIPVVVLPGRRGGSALAAAAVNALLHLALEARLP